MDTRGKIINGLITFLLIVLLFIPYPTSEGIYKLSYYVILLLIQTPLLGLPLLILMFAPFILLIIIFKKKMRLIKILSIIQLVFIFLISYLSIKLGIETFIKSLIILPCILILLALVQIINFKALNIKSKHVIFDNKFGMNIIVILLIAGILILLIGTFKKERDDLYYWLNQDQTGYIVSSKYNAGVTEIHIPSTYKGLPVTTIGAFYNTRNLKSITFDDNVKITTIYNDAFSSCENFEFIEIPKTVTDIGSNAFHNTKWFNNLSDGLIYINNILYAYKGDVTPGNSDIVIKEGIVEINASAFKGKGITSISFPSSLKLIEEGAFQNCDKLITISLPDTIFSISSYTFNNCINLETVNIPSSIKVIGGNAFYNCSNLKNVNFEDNSDLTNIELFAFANCSSLEAIYIPKNVSFIGNWAFYECTSLTIYLDQSTSTATFAPEWNKSSRPIIIQ